MDTKLSIIIDAENKADKAFKEVESGMSKMQTGLTNMRPAFQTMATAGIVGFTAVSAVIAKTVSDYGEAEKMQKMLEHAIIGVSKGTKEQLKQTMDLADALEKKGVLDGDNIKMGLAQLSTFGLSNKAVQGLGGSLADLAVNQFGVSATGEQLSDTANMIAKALNGQFGVLEKSGIRFTEAQKHAIQFGTEMEKVDAINQGFAQNLKFTNDVALTTFEGQMAKLKVQVGNVSESIGQVMIPILLELMKQITPIIEKTLAWIQEHPELTKWILLAGAALTGLVAVVGTLGLVLPSVIAGVTLLKTATLALGASPVILAIMATVAALTALYAAYEKVRGAADGVKGSMDAGQGVLNAVNKELETAKGDKREKLLKTKAELEDTLNNKDLTKYSATSPWTMIKQAVEENLGFAKAPNISALSKSSSGQNINVVFQGNVYDASKVTNDVKNILNRQSTLKLKAGQ